MQPGSWVSLELADVPHKGPDVNNVGLVGHMAVIFSGGGGGDVTLCSQCLEASLVITTREGGPWAFV